MLKEKAILYSRISGRDVNDNLQAQLELCREYATNHDYVITHELAEDDKGASGYDIDLPQLNRVRDLAHQREFQVLVVRELDRLSRNLAKQLIIEEELKARGVRVEYVLEAYDDTPEGRLQKHIRATIAEYEREKITERMTRGRRRSVKNGKVLVAGRPPYGYAITEQSTLTIVLEQAQIVLDIYQHYASRGSVRQIADRLTANGVPSWADLHTKVTHKVQPKGHWSKGSVHQILRNRTYTGVWEYGHPPILVTVPQIISKQLFAQVQHKLDSEQRGGILRHRYLLSGRVRCGLCDYAVPGYKNGNHHYYTCPARLPDRVRTCTSPSWPGPVLDSAVLDYLNSLPFKHTPSMEALELQVKIYHEKVVIETKDFQPFIFIQ